MSGGRERVVLRMSAAILLVDADTRKTISEAQFHFRDVHAAWSVSRSPDEYFVFVGLPPGRQAMTVDAPNYFPLETEILVPDPPKISNSVFEFVLQPMARRSR